MTTIVNVVVKNTFFLFLSQIASYGFGFIYLIYLIRYLGADDYGILSLALAFTTLFGVICDLGLSTLMVREIARDKSIAIKFFININSIKLFLALINFFTIYLLIMIINYPSITQIVIIIIFINTIINSFNFTLNSFFQAYERMEFPSFGNALSSILMFFGVLIGIKFELDLYYFSLIYVISSSIILIFNLYIYLSRFGILKFNFDLVFWKNILKNGIPFGLTTIFVTIFYYIDSIMLSIMINNSNAIVGWYNAAYRIILIPLAIPTIFNTAIFPLMSRTFIKSEKDFVLIYQIFLKYMLILAIPIGIGTTILANRLILTLFGENYINSTIALQILIWSSVFIFIGSPFTRILEVTNRQLIITKMTGLFAIMNISLNFFLIPSFSYIGASIATVMTEFTSLISVIFVCHFYGFKQPKGILRTIIKISLSSFIMAVFIELFIDINIIILIISSFLIYMIFIYFLNIFDENDNKIFKEIKKNYLNPLINPLIRIKI